jgi:glycosyltransferase involved in cell wall biosynthesis
MSANEAPAVSVLMPCYNTVETLPEALESLAGQTLADFETVVVDDGSMDETPEILRSWAAHDPRLRLICRPHQGIVAALQAGLAECRAGLVARMDADDRSHPERLERQLAFMLDNPQVAVAGCLVRAIPPEGVRQGLAVYLEWQNSLLNDEQIRREMFVESPLAHPSVMFRRQAVEQAGGYQDHGWAEDYDLWLRLYLGGARFAKVPQVLLDWRERPDRLTRADDRYSLENFLRAKAHYLARGPLAGRDAVIIWGAGMMGRRLSKHLARQGLPLAAFVDVDPAKIGRTRRGLPVLPPQSLLDCWHEHTRPALLAAVGARGARSLIRDQLQRFGLHEGRDWWSAA